MCQLSLASGGLGEVERRREGGKKGQGEDRERVAPWAGHPGKEWSLDSAIRQDLNPRPQVS